MSDIKTVYFLTQNRHKVIEAGEALAAFPGVRIEQLDAPKHEDKDDTVEDGMKYIASSAAVNAAKRCGKTVVAEDSGLILQAFGDKFPGINTKWIMNSIGYDGILALLAGRDRRAYFRTVLALAEPDGSCVCFEGIVRGSITDRVYGEDVDCMDYDRIFIPEGYDVPFALRMELKKDISHRSRAFTKLGEWLSK